MPIHDITMTIYAEMLVWPNDLPPHIETIQTIEKDGNETSLIHINSHTGTHIDAPRHFIAGAAGIDKIPLEAFCGPCEVVEINLQGGEIHAENLEGKIHSTRVLFRTKNSIQGLLQNAKFHEDFVGLTPDAADFLIKKGVQLVGVDYLSCERGTGRIFEVHQKLLSHGILIIESCDLSQVKSGNYQLIALPLKLKNLDGSPCRAILIS